MESPAIIRNPKGVPPNQAAIVIDGLAALTSALATNKTLKSRLEQCEAEQRELVKSCDLDDETALLKIIKAEVLIRILPDRAWISSSTVKTSAADLLKACHAFISGQLAPLLSDLRQRTKADNSAMEEIAAMDRIVIIQHETPVEISTIGDFSVAEYARQLIACWKKAQTLLANLSTNSHAP